MSIVSGVKTIVLRVKYYIMILLAINYKQSNVLKYSSIFVLRVKQLALRVKHLTLSIKRFIVCVKQLVLRVKQCIKI